MAKPGQNQDNFIKDIMTNSSLKQVLNVTKPMIRAGLNMDRDRIKPGAETGLNVV